MNMYKIIYPLLECRSWLPFFYVKKRSRQIFKSLSFDSLYMCLVYVIGNRHERFSFFFFFFLFDCDSPVVKCSLALL